MNLVVNFDTSELAKLVGELGNAAELLNSGTAEGVNRVAVEARKNTIQRVVSQVRLGESYVDRKVLLNKLATSEKPQAIIEVPDEAVSLANYDAAQRIASNVWTAAKYASFFGTVATPVRLPSGKVAQWIPRTGDQLRGISAGSKQYGITAGVSRGKGVSTFSHVFFMPVLSGKVQAGRWGAFSRPKGGGKPHALYGPSVYQVTKGVWYGKFIDDVGDFLEEQVTSGVSARISRELGAT